MKFYNNEQKLNYTNLIYSLQLYEYKIKFIETFLKKYKKFI